MHQRQVAQSLLELMGKMPYEDITVTQLCQSAGISRRVFYHLFTGKTDALHALLDHTLLDTAAYRADISDPALQFFLYWKDHRNLLDALRDNKMPGLLLERMIENVLNEDYDLRSWIRANGWEEDRDIIIFHISGVMGIVYRWYCSNFRESPEEMASLLKKIATTPLAREFFSK
jgi:AcrR family transcriptional regulator